MKNFIAVFDGYKMSESTLSYAIYLCKSSDAMLTGVFLDAFFYHNYDLKSILKQASDREKMIESLQEKDRKLRDIAVLQFQKACVKAGVKYAVHRDESLPIQEVKYESMFADLLIINEHETFSRAPESSAYEFIDDLLAESQCPVVVVPDVFTPFYELAFLYDGSPSSIFGIKMFGYLFPGFSKLPVTVLTVNDQKNAKSYLPEDLQISTLVNRLFSKVNYQLLIGAAKEQILSGLGKEAGKIVVLGAYQLNTISGLFTDSIADRLLERRDFPVFVPPKSCI